MSEVPLLQTAAQVADAGLQGLGRQIDVPAPRRPLWQRWLLPVLGLVLTCAGIVFFFLPFTNLLLVCGIPLLFCFSRRWENAARSQMIRLISRVRRWLPRRRSRRR
jgi:hypothetical protein